MWIGGHWFQRLGVLADGREAWLYPHVEGVFELFRAAPGAAVWEGQLGTSFRPKSGAFQDRFHAAELLNELLGET